MTMTYDEVKETVDQLRRVAGRDSYILANPSCLRFTYPTGKSDNRNGTDTPVVREDDGILLYDAEFKEHLGFFPGDPDRHRRTRLLPCTNGRQYDELGPNHPDAQSLDEGAEGTCTITGTVIDPAEEH